MIHVDRKLFTRALKAVQPAVERRSTVPILTNLCVVANGSLALEATDLDTWLRAELPYEGEHGEMLLPAPHILGAALAQAGGDTLALEKAEKGTRLLAGPLALDLRAPPADDFPQAGWMPRASFSATWGADVLAQLARVLPAVSTEETRYYLNGIYFHQIAEWEYRAVATDGHRLLMATVMLPDATGELPANFIIPRRFVQQAIGLFGKTKEPVTMRVGPLAPANTRGQTLDLDSVQGMTMLQLTGVANDLSLVAASKLIDGTYPDYRRVIPQGEAKLWIEAERAALLRALACLLPLGGGRIRVVKLTGVTGEIVLSCDDPELGKAQTAVPCGHNLSADFSIGFNSRYLTSMLHALRGETVRLETNDQHGPVRVTDPADTGLLCILMPMRV